MNILGAVNGVYGFVCISGSPSVTVLFISVVGEGGNRIACKKIFHSVKLYKVFILIVAVEYNGVGLGVVSLENERIRFVCNNSTEIGSKRFVENVA